MAAQWLANWSQAFSKSGLGAADDALRPGVRACRDYLIEHRDRVIGKDELFREIWRGRVVTDQSLFQCIGEIRAAHGKTSVRTFPGRGYQWQGSLRRPSRFALPAAALIALIAAAAAALNVVAGGAGRDAAKHSTIALLPVGDDHAGLEGALIEWLSVRVPAVLVTGTESVGVAAADAAELSVQINLQDRRDDRLRAGYRIAADGWSIDGAVEAHDVASLARDLGMFVRETYLRERRHADDPAARRMASYDAALSHRMAGDLPAADLHARILLAEAPGLLAAHRLMAELDIVQDRLPAARQRIDDMLETAARNDDPAWHVAAYLAEVDYRLARREIEAAQGAASAALAAARAAALHRDAGKAAEHLAAIGIEKNRRSQAMNWLVDAHGYYTEGQCTVGTARIDRKVRELLELPAATG